MHIRSALTLAAVAVLTVPALAVPALTGTVVDADATGDMVRIEYNEESETFVYVPVPQRTLNDVSGTTLDHSPAQGGDRARLRRPEEEGRR